MSEKLRAEYPSILHWMIEGCLDWQQNGLQRPKCVKEATEEYFDEQDMFGQWIDECCTLNAQFSCQSSKLFNSWKEFAENNNVRAGDKVNFSRKMNLMKFEKPKKIQGVMKYFGITLKNTQEN